MLRTILSVSGKPGLFKLVSSGKNMIVVESLIDGKRIPIHPRDKVVALGDIAMYTIEEEVPLKEVLSNLKKKENGAKASISVSAKPQELYTYFREVLPTFDQDRVYPTDIKKLLQWYNLLVEKNVDFEAEQASEEAE